MELFEIDDTDAVSTANRVPGDPPNLSDCWRRSAELPNAVILTEHSKGGFSKGGFCRFSVMP